MTEQRPAYSYLLPACHSPGLLTSPCRCSFPPLCHTCAGTPETLHTDTHVKTQPTSAYKQIWVLMLLFNVPALRWGLLLAHKIALNLDSSVPSLFSPAAYRACKEPENISVAKSGPYTQQLGQSFTWASCFAKEMSTFSLSSRLPWKHHAETHQQLYKQVQYQSIQVTVTGSGPEQERWEAFWSGLRCPLWWRPPVTSYILRGHKTIQFWFMLSGNMFFVCFVF